MKKRQIKTIWIINSNKFDTFKAFKRWLWYNLHTGEIIKGSQIWEDTIYRTYKIKKTEGRLIVEIIYDLEQEQKNTSKIYN